MKRTPRENDANWLPVAELARCFGVSPQGFRSSILPLVAPDDRRHGPGGLLVFARAAIEAWANREWERQSRSIVGDVLVGPNSPALERAREIKADLLAIDLAERREEVVCVADVADAHTMFASFVRRGIERLQREHPEAARIMDDALADGLRVLTQSATPESPPAQAPGVTP